jgi:hypothetical protein
MFTFIDPKKAPIGTVLISLISLREGWLTATASRTGRKVSSKHYSNPGERIEVVVAGMDRVDAYTDGYVAVLSDGMPVPGCTSSSLALIRQAAIAAGLAQ